MKKGQRNLIIGILIGMVVITIIVIIFSVLNNSISGTKCAKNYFWTGNECCYDSDNNQVCDNKQKLFQYELDCDVFGGRDDMKTCVEMCISKCAEIGFEITASAIHGSALASYPGSDYKFHCNCVP